MADAMNTRTTHPAAQCLYDSAASRQIDDNARRLLRCDGFALMERAAHSACSAFTQYFPASRRVAVFCGKGNNGGDGFLVAAKLHAAGYRIEVFQVGEPAHEAAAARMAAVNAGVCVRSFDAGDTITADVIVDALLGTGISAPPRPQMAAAIRAIGAVDCPVFSIDVPSGVDASTGQAFEPCVQAAVTISFIARKVGLHTGPGKRRAGALLYADLGVGAQAFVMPRALELRWRPEAYAALRPDLYKHQLGHVLLAGGGPGMPGAVALAAKAALRAGAGMVTVATLQSHLAPVVAFVPEAMVATGDAIDERLAMSDFLVLGPGLGRGAWSAQIFERVLRHARDHAKPILVDADGLFWLAATQTSDWPADCYITPHSAEAARLLEWRVDDVEADRLGAARALRERGARGAVLKGPGSVVAVPGGTHVCAHGNPGMASAGMGDVLSGIAAGLMAPMSRSGDAASMDNAFAQAVALHSATADREAARLGQRSLLAGDVVAGIAHMFDSAAETGRR